MELERDEAERTRNVPSVNAELKRVADETYKRVNLELGTLRARRIELNTQLEIEERKVGGATQADAVMPETFGIGDQPSAFDVRAPRATRIGGALAPGQKVADPPKPPVTKKARLARLANIPALQNYAAFLSVLRSRVKLLVKLFDDEDMDAAADAWEGTKITKGWGEAHMEVPREVKDGYPYGEVRLWLEKYRLFPELLAAAFVSVLSSIDRSRTAQRKAPLPLWDLVRDPHLSTFAKWIGHQHLHDAQLANQWGGRSEGHVALAMSTRDALSYFEALP